MKEYVSFIVCVNDEKKYRRMLAHIRELNVPSNTEIEIITKRKALSMCSAYNQAMLQAKGRIKIYLHQDVYIINRDLLNDIIRIFKDKDIGMIGLVGAKDIPASGKYSSSKHRFGHIIHYLIPDKKEVWRYGVFDDEVEDVLCLDGLLLATQYDIAWREDIFNHFHFYDISQSIEFIKEGYRVVIPSMDEPWGIHDCGKSDYRRYKGYDEQRIKFIREYSNYLLPK